MSLIGICGVGFVGGALKYSFDKLAVNYVLYDKYKGVGNFNQLLTTNIIFLCLPTLYDDTSNKYDTSSLEEIAGKLSRDEYQGIVVIKVRLLLGVVNHLMIHFLL